MDRKAHFSIVLTAQSVNCSCNYHNTLMQCNGEMTRQG